MTLVTFVRIAAVVVALACIAYIAACDHDMSFHCIDTEFPSVYECTRGNDVLYYDEAGRPVDYDALEAAHDADEASASESGSDRYDR